MFLLHRKRHLHPSCLTYKAYPGRLKAGEKGCFTMPNNTPIDYEDIFTTIQWDMEKAAFLLDDTHEYFDCPDLDFPTRDTIESIRNDFKRIAVKIGLLEDLIDKTKSTISDLLA